MLVDNINKKLENSSNMALSNYIKDEPLKDNLLYQKVREKSDKTTISEGNSLSVFAPVYGNPTKQEEKKNDKSQIADMDNAANVQKQMIVLSNTLSAEDYREIEKDGFSVTNSDPTVILCESDKIKAALAKQGVDISKYGGLSDEVLQSIAGNPEIAMQMAAAFENNDIPLNEDNISDLLKTMDQISNIDELSTPAIIYMVRNQLLPTIDNIYKSQYISSGNSNASGISEQTFDELSAQIKEFLQDSGLADNSENMNYAKLLLDNRIEITENNIKYLSDLSKLSDFLLNNENFDYSKLFNSMAIAISEGKRPADALLLDGYSLLDKATDAFNVVNNATEKDLAYLVSEDLELNVKNLQLATRRNTNNAIENNDIKFVTAKRQLEETRLMMSVEANYALLKRGISIDTKSLENLVEELKNIENQYYKNILDGSGVEGTDKNVSTFSNTTELIEALKFQPAYALTLSSGEESLEAIYSRSEVVKSDFEKANLRYETLMTAPRNDLGDNIHKAFRNVDDILRDLKIDITESNRRAVRILAYNETPITDENIMKIKAVDEQVQRAFKNLTPATTLEMIRKGISPLDLSIEQLNEVAVEIQSENPENEAEKFSKFLYKLEQNKEITDEERNAYIGIYRLIAQVEKTDGAAIGSLINQGADITMRNLLTAVRNGKKGKMDYKVDENFAGLESVVKGIRIDEQIENVYSLNCLSDVKENITSIPRQIISDQSWEEMTPEQLKEYVNNVDESLLEQNEIIETEYAREMLAQFEEVKALNQDIYKMLDRYDINNSMANILAASRQLKNPNIALRKIWSDLNIPESSAEIIEQMKNQVMQQFGEAIKNPQEMADAQEALAEIATHAMDTMIIEGENVSAKDIQELRMLNKELMLCSKKAKNESYMIPIETSEGVSGVSLKVIRGERDKGFVDIFFRGELMGKIAASFEAKENGISGVIAVSDEQMKKTVESKLDSIIEMINNGTNNLEQVDIKVAHIPEISYEKFEISSLHKETSLSKKELSLDENENSDYSIQTSRLYGIAEGFIKIFSYL